MNCQLIWWNAQNFLHYDEERVAEERWPQSPDAFLAKLDLVTEVLRSAIASGPAIVALGETSNSAAEALRDRLLPTYKLFSLDFQPVSGPNVALIYPPDSSFSIQPPFVPQYVPESTRPAAVLDIKWRDHNVRLIACHWTARFQEASTKTRSEIARQLSRYIFDYLDGSGAAEQRHAVIVGDLNEEPFGLLEQDLFARRDRARAKRSHWTDEPVKRHYLYNISWRMLGERVPHSTSPHDSAGTFYWSKMREWRTFDHIIVDGSLVDGSHPYVDETATSVVIHPQLFRDGNVPSPYWWDGSAATGGVSDHLPLTTILRMDGSNA